VSVFVTYNLPSLMFAMLVVKFSRMTFTVYGSPDTLLYKFVSAR
jgi:hypothetical protein